MAVNPHPPSLTQQELESRLWAAANSLRGPVDAADFKAHIFPLLFFKRICDAQDEEHEQAASDYHDLLDDEIEADYHRFVVPEGCHWDDLHRLAENIGVGLQRMLQRIEQADSETLAGSDVLKRAPVTSEEQTGTEERLIMPDTTTTQPSPADLRQRAAIARGRERRRAELLPLRTEVAEAIAAVGWRRARPVVESVLGTVPVTGPHGAWWSKVGKRAGAAILAGLVTLPALPQQGALPLKQAQ